MQRETFSLDDRYSLDRGVIFLSGVQALVRLLTEQQALDQAAGLNTGGFVSGYRGSPLGGLDQALWQRQADLQARNIRFQPGVNEELAATAVWGTQQVGLFPGATVDGVFGLWYGKAPGLDRSCDAIRHANAAGTTANGGVLAVVGDDHGCKSSTLPSHSELALKDLGMPVLCPADVQDVLDFGLFGWALSRYSGCWVGLIALADTMDSAATVTLAPQRAAFVQPAHDHDVHLSAGRAAMDQEALLHDVKLPLAVAFARANGINRRFGARSADTAAGGTGSAGSARVGIVTAGKAYLDVRQALLALGLDDDAALEANGVSLLKLGMTWPLDAAEIREFAAGLDTIVVVEEKRAFIETELKTILYGGQAPRIVGKTGATGQPLLPATGEIDASQVAAVLAQHLPAVPDRRHLDRLDLARTRLASVTGQAKTDRLPMFCAGCPHNTSTRVPEGSRASAGIGCHYMAQWMDRDTSTFTQMGGEGANWIGQAPFTSESHIFVNLGDGTYFHSGLLAIRQAVASGVNVTFKILLNDAVAMTGGQSVDGQLSVADLVAQVRAEGVGHVEVVSDNPTALGSPGATVTPREELDAVQRRFRELPGCSVIVYQQVCATELRRRRKRGLAADPTVRVMINESVCEGCGDCSVQSNCVAVEPLATEFGIKRQINQTTCNKDLSCVNGFCPAFVLVNDARLKTSRGVEVDLAELRGRAPLPELGDCRVPVNLLVAGVGGTGVVTISALLGTAAHIDGKAVRTLDMTGLAQKGGAVFGHVRIADDAGQLHGPRIAAASADLLLACDLVSGASKDALTLADDARTIAVINTEVAPTAEFVLHQNADVKPRERLQRIGEFSSEARQVDAARVARAVLGSTATLNVLLLGYAWQLGTIPLSLESLERAIELNGVAINDNLLAFHWGRVAAWDESRLGIATGAVPADFEATATLDTLIEQRKAHLEAYQNAGLARRFAALVAQAREAEGALATGAEGLARAVALGYSKLLAYKDEYEVARLYAEQRWQQRLDSQFESGFALQYLLAPPLLTSHKRRFGAWLSPVFAGLARLRFLRGTALDPFGYLAERRRERWMIGHYEAVVAELLAGLDAGNRNLAVRIAELPISVKGFGHVKENACEHWLSTERVLLESFRQPPAPVSVFDPKRADAA